MSEQIGKYLKIEQLPQEKGKKTVVWRVIGTRSLALLGLVKWYTAWRQYCFSPSAWTIFNRECLLDLTTFLEKINKEHKEKKKSHE